MNPTSKTSAVWSQRLDRIRPRRRVSARRELDGWYRDLFVERLEMSSMVGPRRRTDGIYRWVPYKEAFGPDLVRTVLDYTGASGRLLDPFCGTGTSLLVAAERGLHAHGVELLPYAAFAASTSLAAREATKPKLEAVLERVLAYRSRANGFFPDFPVRDWALDAEVLSALRRLDRGVASVGGGVEADLCRLALLTIVEAMSYSVRDGTSIRLRPPGRREGRAGVRRSSCEIRRAFQDRVEMFADDLASAPDARNCRVTQGDARTATLEQGSVAVFSPPYPNRYDYSAAYQLELGFGFCSNRAELRALRASQLRSHLEAPPPETDTVREPALDEFLAALLARRQTGDETNRIARMAVGFFEDMRVVLERLHAALTPGAPVALVVATQTYKGEILPTDLLIAAIAEGIGMTCKELWLARHKGVAPQQRGFGQQLANRETVLLLSN